MKNFIQIGILTVSLVSTVSFANEERVCTSDVNETYFNLCAKQFDEEEVCLCAKAATEAELGNQEQCINTFGSDLQLVYACLDGGM